jgi:hypothetical protein
VNLHDLRFEQQHRDKGGWSRWKRIGFSRCSNNVGSPFNFDDLNSSSELGAIGRNPSIPFTLGHLTSQQSHHFFTEAQRIWIELFQCSPGSSVVIEFAIERTADRFKYKEQPKDNAREVIEAILTPTAIESRFSFQEFCQFLARFGPTKTVMLKIASLLSCSNGTGKWLVFERDRSNVKPPFACFDREMPNCLIVCHGDNVKEKVFNNPVVEVGKEEYIVDESGQLYRDWGVWFRRHPVRQGEN